MCTPERNNYSVSDVNEPEKLKECGEERRKISKKRLNI